MNTNEQDLKLASARFKRDYVAWLAIGLFFIIMALEVIMAFSIPILVKNESAWAKQVARQDMSAMFDGMRSQLRRIASSKDSRIAGEGGLLLILFDEQAIYLRENHEKLSKRQIAEFESELRKIAPLQNKLSSKKSSAFSRTPKLDTTKIWQILENKIKTEEK